MSTDTPAVRNDRSKRRIATTLFICAVLVLGAAILLYFIFSTEPTASRDGAVRQSASLVDVTQGEFGSFRPMIEAMGTVRPAREISLSARVEGEIVGLHESFVPGGFVDAGEMLVRIDDADYRIALEQRGSALEQAIAELEIERGEQQAARSDYESFDRDLPPERRALVLREPQLRSAEANVESARADVEQAELNLERTTVEAPFDAHVLSREINLGSQVSPGAALGRLVGLDTFWVEATVPVSRLQWLRVPDGDGPGSSVVVRNRSAWPQEAVREGEVFRLIGELEGSTRLARVLISVEDPLARESDENLPRLMLGEYVEVRIEGREIGDVLRLDRDYIRADDTVWLMVDGRLVIQPVSIVFQDERYAYIDEGLSADDRVVTTRLATVQEGLRLRLDDDTDSGEDIDA
ncbi:MULTISPECIES: efflux RND transporter periplasmic adaptor subunit [unclassified Wenzhouxiangella]|uniref:efflux RND transporter periplasmic adaptor subunit n=1 Tax=unclassified Wenzhouxiangella TaxID=2613841 RepID=UPI001C6E1B6C|nr:MULTISPECIES: efflux RND transporter periplasmic adaptor subunit [unclassified Wenzhouxiangella]